MKFTEDQKEVKEFSNNYFGFGVHKVQLTLAETGTTDAGKEYIEIHVAGGNEEEDSARLWFVGGATVISFNTARQIIVHNAKTPEDKVKAGKAVDSVPDTEALAQLLNDIIGGELWFTKYHDPKRTYQNAAGETKKSVNKNVYGYEPKVRSELLQGPVNPSDYPADEPFETKPGEKSDNTVPKSW